MVGTWVRWPAWLLTEFLQADVLYEPVELGVMDAAALQCLVRFHNVVQAGTVQAMCLIDNFPLLGERQLRRITGAAAPHDKGECRDRALRCFTAQPSGLIGAAGHFPLPKGRKYFVGLEIG